MEQKLAVEGAPINVQLLGEDELLSIRGGLGPVGVAAALIGGGIFAALLGAAVGALMYAAFRNSR